MHLLEKMTEYQNWVENENFKIVLNFKNCGNWSSFVHDWTARWVKQIGQTDGTDSWDGQMGRIFIFSQNFDFSKVIHQKN